MRIIVRVSIGAISFCVHSTLGAADGQSPSSARLTGQLASEFLYALDSTLREGAGISGGVGW